jgi:integrase
MKSRLRQELHSAPHILKLAIFMRWPRMRLAANISTGPVFRPIAKGQRLQEARLTGRSVAKIVKAHAARIGLDPAVFSGHSLRSGFLTSAAARCASIFKMMDVSRHRSVDTLRGYVRDAELFRDHAGAGLL